MSSIRYDAPTQVYSRLWECIETFQQVVKPKTGPDFNAQEYHDNLDSALKCLKLLSAQIMDSGRMAGFRQLIPLHYIFEAAAKTERATEANEIFWSRFSDYFPLENIDGVSHKGLSNTLRLKLLAQMIEQEEDPGRLANVELNDLPDDAYMEGLTTVLRLVHPP